MKIVLFLFFYASCSSTGPVIEVVSTPADASVSYYDFNKKQFIPLGKTPFKKNQKELGSFHTQKEKLLQISKEGHVLEKIILDVNPKENLKVSSNLEKIDFWTESNDYLSSKVANKIGLTTKDIYQKILIKEYDQALALTEMMNKRFPMATIYYDIKASIYMLKGNTNLAVEALKKSIQLDPQNVQANTLLKELQKGTP